MEEASTLQQRIDAISYPPTHRYDLRTLAPEGDLKRRLDVIDREFGDFFKWGSLLDVGCNKGYFSLIHLGPKVAIDPDPACVALCRDLGIRACEHSFGSFESDGAFDKIWIGNGPHYPFVESGGWGWVEKLAALSEGWVLLEGPVDMKGRDARRCIPKELAPEFTNRRMMEAFDPWFFFVKQVESPLVDRFFTLFAKKERLFYATMAEYADYLESLYGRMAPFTHGHVVEICTRHDRGIMGKKILPHTKYTMVDRNPKRPGLDLDARHDRLPACDVIVSTALLHHTPFPEIPAMIGNMAKSCERMVLSGPSAKVMPELMGDHEYHVDVDEMRDVFGEMGWRLVHYETTGLSRPHCEVLTVFECA